MKTNALANWIVATRSIAIAMIITTLVAVDFGIGNFLVSHADKTPPVPTETTYADVNVADIFAAAAR